MKNYKGKRFCSVICAGMRSTSPKASRGKSGIRTDISDSICFFSRWEANVARVYTYRGIAWVYAPKSFDIGGQMYTPDFYLPETDTYIEVKNFWGEYSKVRDAKFRKAYPELKLHVLLRTEYLELQKQYAHRIPNWEYATSKSLTPGQS